MTPKEIDQLIKLKKAQLKQLGLVADINHLLFGGNKVLQGLLWGRVGAANLGKSADLQDLLAIQAITPTSIVLHDNELEVIELQLASIKLTYALYEKEASGNYGYFFAKDYRFYLWADDVLVLTLGAQPSKLNERIQVSDELVRRFIEGSWIAELQHLVKQVKAIDTKQLHANQQARDIAVMHDQMESFGISAHDVEQLKVAKTKPTTLSLLKRFSRMGIVH